MSPAESQSSERRQATVIFADLSGFTAMSERMEPEEVTALMNDCFEMMGSIIKFYGGVIDKFIGDCVMAVFGVPLAIENAPLKAVNAAIELRRGVQRFSAQRQLADTLDVHVGINTGTVLAGEVGASDKKQFTVIGDAVNLAARLEGLGKAGQVLVGPATYHATRLDFEYRELGPIELKGKSKPVPVFELVSDREKMHRGRGWDQRQVHSDMVGRHRELQRLLDRRERLRQGHGGIAHIVGEAGIGKSRLLAELWAQLPPDSVVRLEGRAVSIGRNLSFHPIVDLLRNLAGVHEDDSDARATERLRGALEGLMDAQPASEAMPFMATLMGLELHGADAARLEGVDGEALEKLLQRSLRELLVRASERRPLVVCLEDLHWADGSSLRMVEGLYHLVSHHPILFLEVFRPGYPETSDRLLAAARGYGEHYVRLDLQPLDDELSGELLDNLVQARGVPQATREQILRRADGNPFFIEEVVRSLVDQGALVRREGRFEITERIHRAEVPTSINDVIMARIDRLDPDTRELLRTASVLGRRFFRRILKEVIDTPLDTDEHLRILTESQFLQEQIHMQELEYLFKHALAQEVAYQSLLVKRRKELHLRVARSIERVFASRISDFYGMLAFHYSCGEDLEKAGRYMELAGNEAARCSASIEALSYFQAALELYAKKTPEALDPAALLQLQENTGRAYFARGHYVEAIEYFEKVLAALGLRVARSRPRAWLGFALGMARLVQHLWLPTTVRHQRADAQFHRRFSLLSDYVRALGCVDAGMLTLTAAELPVRILDVGVDRVERGVELLSSSSVSFCWSGASFAISERILAYVASSEGAKRAQQALYLRFGEVIHGFLAGHWDHPYQPEVVARGYEKGELWHTSTLLVFWIYIALEQGDFERASSMIQEMERAAQAYNDHFVRSLQLQARSLLLLQRRQLESALETMDRTIAVNIDNGQEVRNLSLYGLKARAQVYRGDLEAAVVSLERARVLVAREDRVIPFHHSNVLIGSSLAALGELARAPEAGRGSAWRYARSRLKRAERNARRVASEQVEVQRLWGVGHHLMGAGAKALECWERALARAEELGARVEAARTRHLAGLAMLEAPGDGRLGGLEPQQLVDQGRRELEALGVVAPAEPWWRARV